MDIKLILIITHIIGTALGVGGATVSDALFFRMLKDNKVDKKEFEFLSIASGIIWYGLIILVLSGFGFLLYERIMFPEARALFNPTLWVKLLVVLVIFLNGLVFHWKVFPIIKKCVGQPMCSPEFLKHSRLIFTTGAISAISWYSALIVGVLTSQGFRINFLNLFGIYVALIIIGIIAANIVGKLFINYLEKK